MCPKQQKQQNSLLGCHFLVPVGSPTRLVADLPMDQDTFFVVTAVFAYVFGYRLGKWIFDLLPRWAHHVYGFMWVCVVFFVWRAVTG